MTYLDFALIAFLILAFLNYCAERSVLYPPFIFSVMFLLDLLVFRLGLIEVNPLHPATIEIIAAGATLFSLGGLVARLVPRDILQVHLVSPRQAPSNLPRNIVMLVLLAGLPVMAYEILQLSRSVGGGLNVLAAARLAMVESAQSGEPSQSFILDYFTWIAGLAALLLATEKRDRQFWTVASVAFIACILSTGRTGLLMLIFGLSGIRLIQLKQESIWGAVRYLRWPVALFGLLYVALIFTNKSTEGISGGVAGIALFFVFSYIVGPLAGFDSVVQNPRDFVAASSHIFEFPLKTASLLHLTNYTPPPKFDDFVLVPFPTNVYTVFKFYFLELGLPGTLLLLGVLGFLHALLYRKARCGGKLSLYLFGFSLYSVLMVIFDDAYSATGSYVRALTAGVIYFAIASIPLRLLPKLTRTPENKNMPAPGPSTCEG